MSQPHPDFHSLSVAERIQLAQEIWDSIVDENPGATMLTDVQREELRTRLAEHEQDPSAAISWDLVRSELFQRDH